MGWAVIFTGYPMMWAIIGAGLAFCVYMAIKERG